MIPNKEYLGLRAYVSAYLFQLDAWSEEEANIRLSSDSGDCTTLLSRFDRLTLRSNTTCAFQPYFGRCSITYDPAKTEPKPSRRSYLNLII